MGFASDGRIAPPSLGYLAVFSRQQGGAAWTVALLYFVSLRIIGLFTLVVRYHIAQDIAFVLELVFFRMDRDIACFRHVQRSRTMLGQNRGRALLFPGNPGKLSFSPFSRASRAIFGEGDPTPSNGRLFRRPLDGVGFSRHQGACTRKMSYGRTSTGVQTFRISYRFKLFTNRKRLTEHLSKSRL